MNPSIAHDTLWGGDGDDHPDGGYGDDNIRGGAGDDIITDMGGSDNIQGGDGNDVIQGGGGTDLILGGFGNDFIITGEDNSEAFGGAAASSRQQSIIRISARRRRLTRGHVRRCARRHSVRWQRSIPAMTSSSATANDKFIGKAAASWSAAPASDRMPVVRLRRPPKTTSRRHRDYAAASDQPRVRVRGSAPPSTSWKVCPIIPR
jgi:hypothetical protein